MRSSEKIDVVLNGQSENWDGKPPTLSSFDFIPAGLKIVQYQDVSHSPLNANVRKQTKTSPLLVSCLWRKHSATALGVTQQLNINACGVRWPVAVQTTVWWKSLKEVWKNITQPVACGTSTFVSIAFPLQLFCSFHKNMHACCWWFAKTIQN